jgi:uncharacterized LabA/DUF88 family protein
MERVAIFIDGANFYYGLKSINNRYTDFHFNFEKFFQFLAKGCKFIGFWYYTAPIKGDQSLNHDHQLLLSRLEKIEGHHVCLCRRQKIFTEPFDLPVRYENKMDDVWLAVDMVNEAWKNTYDVAIMISGDGDMLPAVKMVIENLKKKVIVVGFPERISYSLIQNCTLYKPLSKQLIKKYHI